MENVEEDVVYFCGYTEKSSRPVKAFQTISMIGDSPEKDIPYDAIHHARVTEVFLDNLVIRHRHILPTPIHSHLPLKSSRCMIIFAGVLVTALASQVVETYFWERVVILIHQAVLW